MVDAKDLPEGLKGHVVIVNQVLDWCRNWVSQDQFDALATENRFSGGKQQLLGGPGDDDFILGTSARQHLGALQHLQHFGWIGSETRDGVIWYKTKQR